MPGTVLLRQLLNRWTLLPIDRVSICREFFATVSDSNTVSPIYHSLNLNFNVNFNFLLTLKTRQTFGCGAIFTTLTLTKGQVLHFK